MDDINVLTEKVIGLAIDVHRELGPGLLESAYEQCLCYELSTRGIAFQFQQELPVRYKGVLIDCKYRYDVLVENRLLLETQRWPSFGHVSRWGLDSAPRMRWLRSPNL